MEVLHVSFVVWKDRDHTSVVQIQHGYDRGGNRLYRRDMVATAAGQTLNELYTYDQMNQLVKLERGALNSSNTAIVSNTFEEDFTYDVAGNWLNYKQDASGDGTFDVNQTRTHNAANEILTISGGNTLVSHDRNGCMTKIPQPNTLGNAYTLVYDAWNRLISVSDGDTVVATYVYDARNHRIKKTVGNTVTLSYFNRNWQEVESVTAGVTTTYVYGLRYIDDIICRTTSSNGNIQTLYAVQDANWNVVALVNTSGTVAERITYDSFGRVTFRNSDFTTKVSSSYGWSKTFTGQTDDVETGLMLYRNRYYHPNLGRFITRDPIGYEGYDVNLHRYVGNMAPNNVDSSGTIVPLIVGIGIAIGLGLSSIGGCNRPPRLEYGTPALLQQMKDSLRQFCTQEAIDANNVGKSGSCICTKEQCQNDAAMIIDAYRNMWIQAGYLSKAEKKDPTGENHDLRRGRLCYEWQKYTFDAISKIISKSNCFQAAKIGHIGRNDLLEHNWVAVSVGNACSTKRGGCGVAWFDAWEGGLGRVYFPDGRGQYPDWRGGTDPGFANFLCTGNITDPGNGPSGKYYDAQGRTRDYSCLWPSQISGIDEQVR